MVVQAARHGAAAQSRQLPQPGQEKHTGHYDLGNDMYQRFLDPRMQYSSAVFNSLEDSLADAQTNKLTRICEQLRLSENDHLLEVGTGWGGLALFAATHYGGCRVTTTTISDEQLNYAKAQVRAAGLESKITLLDQDYRSLRAVR